MPIRQRRRWAPTIGALVQIRQNGHLICEGYVESVTKDDQVLWLARDGVQTRTMIHRVEGYEVWHNEYGGVLG